jgi:hypothetical protein
MATASPDCRRIVIKIVNYQPERNTLVVRFQSAGVPANAVPMLHTIAAALMDSASFNSPNASQALNYSTDFSVHLEPYTVPVVEIRAK